MKKIFALMLAPVVLLLILMSAGSDQAAAPSRDAASVQFADLRTETSTLKTTSNSFEQSAHARAVSINAPVIPRRKSDSSLNWDEPSSLATPTDSLIAYAISLMGSPYVFGGTDSDGFDCSGFTSHVFQEFNVPVTRSSTTQSEDGIPVSREEASPGDLVIFTGTNPQVREPGHVGIVISEPGDTISFVHASSNGGVKISQVEGTGYDRRFLGIRRVL